MADREPIKKAAPEVVFDFPGELKPGELEEMTAKRDALLREMGYLPPNKDHDVWWRPEKSDK